MAVLIALLALSAWAGATRDQRESIDDLARMLDGVPSQVNHQSTWCSSQPMADNVERIVAVAKAVNANLTGEVRDGSKLHEQLWAANGLVTRGEEHERLLQACKLRVEAAELVASLAEACPSYADGVAGVTTAWSLWKAGHGQGDIPQLAEACANLEFERVRPPDGPWRNANLTALKARLDGEPQSVGCPRSASDENGLGHSVDALESLTLARRRMDREPIDTAGRLQDALAHWPTESVWLSSAAEEVLVEVLDLVAAGLRADLDRLVSEAEGLDLIKGDLSGRIDAVRQHLAQVSLLAAADSELLATVEETEKALTELEVNLSAAMDGARKAVQARLSREIAFRGSTRLSFDGNFFCQPTHSRRRDLTPEEMHELLAGSLETLRDTALLRNVTAKFTGALTQAEALRCPQVLVVEAELTECAADRLFENGQYPYARDKYYAQAFDRVFIDSLLRPTVSIGAAQAYRLVLRNSAGAKLDLRWSSLQRVYARLDGRLLNAEGTILMPLEYADPLSKFIDRARPCPD
jgi:hypothetical protein